MTIDVNWRTWVIGVAVTRYEVVVYLGPLHFVFARN